MKRSSIETADFIPNQDDIDGEMEEDYSQYEYILST